MYKNQLQELAQRSCFNLPCYTCIREGPDHAPRFKATVSFNGEVFESPGYHTTLRQAEHAAAEVALAILSQRGPTPSLTARILDETGVCKNLLQETAQRAGISLPVYNSIRSGPKHLPIFKCVVEIGGRHFKGEPAKTKKQAEKNAATAAWSAINHSSPSPHVPLLLGRPGSAENGDAPILNAVRKMDERPSYQLGSRLASSKQFLGVPPLPTAKANSDSLALEQREGAAYHTEGTASSSTQRQAGRHHQRRHSLSGMESPLLSREAVAASRTSGGGDILGRIMLHHQQQQIRGLPYQSLSERFELKRPSLLEELQHREEEDNWFHQEQTPSSLAHSRKVSSMPFAHCQGNRVAMCMPVQSQSDRFELEMHRRLPLEEIHPRDEEEWLCGDLEEGNSGHGKDRNYGLSYGHIDGLLQNEAILNSNNQREGWMTRDLLKQSLGVERGHRYREGWSKTVCSKKILENERDPTLKQDHGYSSGYQEGWPSKQLSTSSVVEHDWSPSQGSKYSKTSQRDKSTHDASSSSATSFAFTSLWSKSAQWWGSDVPSTTSSAAAAVASSFGLRPPRSAAPVVKVRQMVPVCSALHLAVRARQVGDICCLIVASQPMSLNPARPEGT